MEATPGLAKLDLKPNTNGTMLKVYVTPSVDQLSRGRADIENTQIKPVHLITVDLQRKRLDIHPHYTRPEEDGSFKPKRLQSTISFDLDVTDLPKDTDEIYALMERQPSCFTVDPNFGLGLKKEYAAILVAVSELSDSEILYIGDAEEVDGEFKVSLGDLDRMTLEINRIDSRAQVAETEVKNTTAYNLMATAHGKKTRTFRLGQNEIRQLIQSYAADPKFRDPKSQLKLVKEVVRSAHTFAIENPEAAEQLVTDVQLTRLEKAIAEYEAMMVKKLNEGDWQKFFQREPFLLSSAFGYPVTYVNSQPYVGGRRIDGKGEKIGDFLFKNSVNNNAALIEIKKPQTPLSKKYRDGVSGPDDELSGGVTQVLDQRYQMLRTFPLKQADNEWHGENEVNDFEIDCVLVIGVMPTEKEKRRSFQLYRKNSHGVKIVTFDEVLQQLKNIHKFLGASKPAKIDAKSKAKKSKPDKQNGKVTVTS